MGNFDGNRFSGSPYYNDYNEAKKFLSVLFRPGVAVQARELTQLQTILQNQINRFGNNIFKDGSVVSGGQAASNSCKYFRVDPTLVNTNGTAAYLGKLIALSSNIADTAKVLHIESPTTTDPFYVFFVEYQTGISPAGWLSATSFQVVDSGLTGLTATVSGSIPFKGDATLATITDGIWYVDGYFVLAEQQTTAAFEPGTSVTGRVFDGVFCKIGYQVVRSVVTPSEDSSLNDPSYGSYNYAAPGSDRYKIELDLVALPFQQTSTGDVLYTGFSDTDFVEVTRVVDGSLVKTQIDSVYANLEKTLARRTYDESGSYTVRDFGLSIVEHYKSKLANGTVESTDEFGDYITGVYTAARGGDKSKLVYAVEPGKAYIYGHEFETYQKSFLTVDKARTTDRVEGLNIVPNFGTYVDVLKVVGASFYTTSNKFYNIYSGGAAYLANLDKYQFVTLVGDTSYVTQGTPPALTGIVAPSSSNVIGYARLRFVQNVDTTTSRIYLGDIVVFAGMSLANTKFIYAGVPVAGNTPTGNTAPTISGSPTTATAGTCLFTTKAFYDGTTTTASPKTPFTDSNKNSLIFSLPISGTVPKTVLSYDSVIYKTITVNVPANTTDIERTLSSTGSTTIRYRDDAAKHIVIDPTGNVVTSIPANGKTSYSIRTNNSSGGTDEGRMWITFSTNTGGNNIATGDYTIVACLDVNTANTTTYRTKTLSTATGSILALGAGDSRYYLSVSSAPVFDVYAYSKITHTTQGDVTNKFVFHDGVTNSAYTPSYLTPITGYTPDATTTNYTVTGLRYFARSGSFGPFLVNSYSTVDYSKIPAGNTTLVDYRPDIDNRPSSTAYQATSYPSGLPGRGESFNITYDYYLSRIDKVVLTANRTFEVVKGTPALTPSIPADKDDAMTLFTVGVGAYTISPSDTKFTVTDNKRYTMRDIGALETRINRIEYATTLSQLEVQSQSLDVVDTTGASRFKTGILTDTFNTFGIADVSNRQFNSSLDFTDGTLRPRFIDRNVKLARSTSQPGSSLRAPTSDGIVTLDYTTDILLSQPFASQSISVNPYNVVSWVGSASSVPASDVWTDTQARPDIVVNTNAENDAAEAMVNAQGTSWGSWQTTWTGRTSQRLSNGFVGWDTFNRVKRANNLTNVPYGTVLADGSVYTAPASTPGTNNFYGELNDGNSAAIGLRKVTNTVTQRRTGTRLVNNPTVVTTVLGTRIVDVSLAFYMRAKNVVVTAQGLKPLTQLYSFFDNQSVQDDVYSVIDATISTVSQGSSTTPTVVSITIPAPYKALMDAKYGSAGDGSVVKKTVRARVIIPYVTATQYSANPDATLKLLASDKAIAADENDLLGLDYADLQTSGTASVGLAVWKPNLINPGTTGTPTATETGLPLTGLNASSTYNSGTGVLTLRGDWNFFTGFTTGVLNTVTPVKLLLSGIQTSDATGYNKFMFAIPRNTFRTGGRLFRLTDSPTNTARTSTTSAECTYRAQGTIQTTESTVISIRTPNITRQDVTEEVTNSTSITQFYVAQDPLAQTFFVDSLQYPNGVYLPSVKLCFRAKDANIPVKVQIRTTVNGYPHSYEVLPFAEKMLYPSDVNTTETPSFDAGFTEFAFSTPVFLPPGEYAVVVMSNSNAYQAWIAEIGAKKWGTQERITEQPATGSLFKSQNATTWSAEQTQDLMFELEKCVFTSQVQASTFSNVVEPIGNKPSNDLTPSNNADLSTNTEVYYSLANVISQDTAPQGTTITYKIATKDKDSKVLGSLSEVIPGEDYQFTNEQVLRLYTNVVPAIASARDDLVMSVEMSTDDPNVSPCLDTERLAAILVENYINNDTHDIATLRNTGTLVSTDNKELVAESKNVGIELLPGAIDPNSATITHPKPTARYMTRVTTLQPGYESDGVAVFLTANKPSGTQIEVYGKFKFTDDSSVNNFDDLPWYRIPVATLAKNVALSSTASNVGTETNTSGDEFVEFKYELKAGIKPSASDTTSATLNPFFTAGSQTLSPRKFSAYAIKICLFSSSPSNVPVVQDFRSISHI